MIDSLFYGSMSNVLSQWSDFRVSRNLYKAYFNMQKSEKTKSSGTDADTKTQNTKKVTYKNSVDDKLGKLSESMSKSVQGLESAFTVDKKTGEIDHDKAYSAAQDLVNSYNDLVSTIRKSGDKTISGKHEFIANMTNAYSKRLENVGITVGSDGKMSIDKEKFNEASSDDLDKIFGKKASFADFMGKQASQLSAYASVDKSVKSVSTYTNTGSKNYSPLSSGQLLNMLK